MPIITITRGKYSGGEEIAENVAQELGARCVSDEVLRETAKDYRIEEGVLSEFFDTNPSMLDRWGNRRQEYVAFIRATLLDMCADNNLVYHGNAGQELLRDVPHALKVRLMLSFNYRTLRIMEQFNCSHEHAEQMVTQIDEERTERTRYYYEADWRDAGRYDLVIRMDGTRPPFVEDTILAMVAQPRFQLTEEKTEAFLNAQLQSRLQAMAAVKLGSHYGMMHLSVQDHVVTMEGSFPNSDVVKLDQLLEQMRSMNEVTEVIPKLTAGFAFYR